MGLLRKRLADEKNVIYRAVCDEFEQIVEAIATETVHPKPYISAIAAAHGDRHLAGQ